MADDTTPDRFEDGAAESADAGPADQHEVIEDDRLLARVPEWVVSLGAGSLFTATLLTLAGSAFLWYSVATGRWYGYERYEILLAALQFSAVTVFQAVGVSFARKRVRWMWVMLAGVAGSLTFVALPFTALALLCVGLGKYHFTFDTPMSVIRGEDGDDSEDGTGTSDEDGKDESDPNSAEG